MSFWGRPGTCYECLGVYPEELVEVVGMVEVSAVEKVWMNGIHTINGFLPPLLSYPVRSTCVDFKRYIFTACSSYGFFSCLSDNGSD